MIPNQFVQDVLARTDIVELVGRYVTLRKMGASFTGLCPFHNEKSPSFSVSPSKQFYYCFGCGVSGTALGFLMEYSGYAFPEAVEELARTVGLTVPTEVRNKHQSPDQADEESNYRMQLLQNNLLAAQFYKKQLKQTSNKAVEYLKKRGVSGEIAAKYGVGYAPNDWQALNQIAPNYHDASWIDCGLVIEKKNELPSNIDNHTPLPSRRYDRFRDRIMFPIRSTRGEIIGFGGRVIDQGEPKYLNSPETALFNKSHELYGLNEARMAIRAAGYVVVTEGYMDVIALAQWGFQQTVATLGTAVGSSHIQKLFRYTDHIIFSFDGDSAGRKAAWRALEASLPILTEIRRISFLFLPIEHDPDSFVRQEGTQAFQQAIVNALPLSQVLLNTLIERHNIQYAEGRTALLQEAKPMLQSIQAGMLRLQLTKGLAYLTKISSAEVEQFLKVDSKVNSKVNSKIDSKVNSLVTKNIAIHSSHTVNTNHVENNVKRYGIQAVKTHSLPLKMQLEGGIKQSKPRLSKEDWIAQQKHNKTGIRTSTGALAPQASKAYLLALVLLKAPEQYILACPWLVAWRTDLKNATLDEKNLALLCDALEYVHQTIRNDTIMTIGEADITQYISLQAEQGKSQALMGWLQAAYAKESEDSVSPAVDDAVRLAAYLRYVQLQSLCKQAADKVGSSTAALQDYKHLNGLLKQAQAAYVIKPID